MSLWLTPKVVEPVSSASKLSTNFFLFFDCNFLPLGEHTHIYIYSYIYIYIYIYIYSKFLAQDNDFPAF